MSRSKRLSAWFATASLGTALLAAPGSAQGARAPASAGSASGKAATPTSAVGHAITLITGDRVTLSDDGHMSIERQPGRQNVRFVSYNDGKRHLHVIPSDALPLLQADRLDSRLFDVTALREFGYDDSRADLPLIVRYAGKAAQASARATFAAAKVTRELPALDALAIRAAKANNAKLWASLKGSAQAPRTLRGGVAKVWLDGKRQPALDVSVPHIGAPAAWQAGYDGTGVTVAVLDTGIDATHPDLAGKVVAEQNFTDGVEDGRDLVGHGTHVASTIAGTGAASQGRYKGVAPGAQLLDGKVCMFGGCADSWILAGMEWAAAERHAAIVNMSLGTMDSPGVDPLESAVQLLTTQYGTLFVVAAGNNQGDQSVNTPASADAALAVGAMNDNDQLADFSNRGPRVGDWAIKPDIAAPGVNITAARGKDAVGVPGGPDDLYTTISGTSMATPHVAGAAALLVQRHPGWPTALLKSTLMGSSMPNPAVDVFGQGAGRVDIAAAITQTLSAAPASVSFGQQQWPHTDDQPMPKAVTYHNGGAADATLSLAMRVTGPDGAPAPAGTFTLNQQALTVPAGGEAAVTLTADTRTAPVGRYSGYLTATAGGQVVGTPFAVESEPERYPLTLVHTNRDGTPADNYSVIVFRLDQFASYVPYDADGTAELRLPPGRYAVFSAIFGGFDGTGEGTSTLLVQPQLDFTGAQTVALDARLAKEVTVTVPDSSARGVWGEFTAHTQAADLPVPLEMNMGSFSGFDGAYLGQVGPRHEVDGFVSKMSGELAKVKPDGTYGDSPYVYNLTWFQKGRMLTGLDRTLAPKDLATVREEYAQQVAGSSGGTASYGVLPDVDNYITSVFMPFTLPFTRTEYYNTNAGVVWTKDFQERIPNSFTPRDRTRESSIAYEAGRSYAEQWNHAVFGPSLADPRSSMEWVTRRGDSIMASPPMFGDGAGRQGSSLTSSRHIALYRNGGLVAQAANLAGSFTVPADDAEYRLQVDAGRGAPFSLSTSNSAVWTFHSAHVAGNQPVRLPLSTVHFAPQLDGQNAAAAGQIFSVPVSVASQPSSAAGKVTTLTIEVSFDDGKTWQPTPLIKQGTGWLAQITHPAGDGFASLRAKAAEDAGNTVEQTIIRAYRITAGG